METKRIFELIESRKDELFELLSTFIKINTENYRDSGNEKELAELIHKMCLDMGLESDLFSPLSLDGFTEHPDYIPDHALEDRYNVVARYKGSADIDELMLMGHSDTVEIGDLANWERDPLSGDIADGKIWGRGACDDKYALATVMFIMKLLKEEGFVPKKNLLFAAYSDEEHGGSHGALAAVLKYPCPNIVSMDGRAGQIWHCGSGGSEYAYYFHTAETVDSARLTASAIPIIMEELDKFAENRRKELSENPFYAGTIIPDSSCRWMGVRAGNHGSDLDRGVVTFGFYTDKSKEEIYAELDAVDNAIKSRLAPLGIIGDGFVPEVRFFHYVWCDPNSDDIKMMLDSAKDAGADLPLVCGSCLSDLSVISKYGSSRAYGFGIGRDFSKVGGAHQPNEFIECDKLVDYAKTIAGYILRVLG